MPITVSHNYHATTPDLSPADPFYGEVRSSQWNEAHIATLSATAGNEIFGAFSNDPAVNVSFSTNAGGQVIASANVTAAPSPVNVTGANGSSVNAQTIAFSNANGISLGVSTAANGATVTGSYTVPTQSNQSLGIYASSQTFGQSSSSTYDARSLTVFGSGGVSVGWSNGSLGISGQTTAAQTAQTGISGIQVSDNTYTSGTVTFRNLNGISFGSSGANGVSASYTVPTVTNSSWTVSDNATSATVGRLAFTQSNGLTLSLSTSNNGNHTVIGSYTVPSVTQFFSKTNTTFNGANISGSITNNTDGLQLSLSAAAPAGSSWTVSDNATSATVGRLAFTQSNGLTLSLSTSNNGNHTVIGSYTVPTVPAQLSVGVSTGGNTAGDTGVFTGRVVFAGGNNITLSGSSNGGSVTYTISGANAGGAQTAISGIIASDATYTSGTVSFSNQNGVTIGSSVNGVTQYIRLSVANQTNQTLGIYNSSQTTGASSSSTYDARSLSIAYSGNISGGWTNGSMLLNVTTAAQTNQTGGIYNSSQTTGASSSSTYDLRSITHVFSGNISGGWTNGSLLFNVTTPAQTNQTIGFYAIGNTTNNSSTTFDARTAGTWNALGAMTLGFSNGSVQVSAPATSSLVGSSGLSISTAGATITAYAVARSEWNNLGGLAVAGAAASNSIVSVQPFMLEWPLAFSNVVIPVSVASVATAANNSSAYLDISASGVFYTRNASTLSSIASFSQSYTQSWSSNATGTVTGGKLLTATIAAQSLTPGNYWLAYHLSTNSTATGGAATTGLVNTISMILGYNMSSGPQAVAPWGNQSNATQGAYSGLGVISTGATLASIGFSIISVNGTSALNAPVGLGLRNQTYQ